MSLTCEDCPFWNFERSSYSIITHDIINKGGCLLNMHPGTFEGSKCSCQVLDNLISFVGDRINAESRKEEYD